MSVKQLMATFCASAIVWMPGDILGSSPARGTHGDARLIDQPNVSFFPMAVDKLVFPSIPVGKISVTRYRVRSLPQVIYPSGFYLEVPFAEDEDLPLSRGQPWRGCLIHASLIASNGSIIVTRKINLGRDRLGSSSGKRNHRKIFFSFTDYEMDGTTSLPRHLSYDLEVKVLRPSLRASDTLTVKAFTLLPGTKAAMERHASP